ncbi:MAG: hypothetical protein JSU79_10995 [Dehalococcoidales bacterium]|nr:MAG: hypothetical protein JSU79_10995 [Dehalococcoidales bacterium]
MPFKVKCTLVSFTGDPENFPCHFNYEIGDSFTYDGEKFEGRICNGLLKNMAPVIWNTVFYGEGDYDRMIYLYSGLSVKDPEMKKYDGVGYRPLKEVPKGADSKYLSGIPPVPPKSLIKRKRGFTCDDTRTGARFTCEPVNLASGGDMLTYYNRAMSILDKIRQQPGMTADEILEKYTEFEREEVYPPIYNLNVSLMMDELAVVEYIDIIDGKAYPK